MKAKCKTCGDWFTLTKEEVQLHEDGECGLPEQCEDCFLSTEAPDTENNDYSDADSGL